MYNSKYLNCHAVIYKYYMRGFKQQVSHTLIYLSWWKAFTIHKFNKSITIKWFNLRSTNMLSSNYEFVRSIISPIRSCFLLFIPSSIYHLCVVCGKGFINYLIGQTENVWRKNVIISSSIFLSHSFRDYMIISSTRFIDRNENALFISGF